MEESWEMGSFGSEGMGAAGEVRRHSPRCPPHNHQAPPAAFCRGAPTFQSTLTRRRVGISLLTQPALFCSVLSKIRNCNTFLPPHSPASGLTPAFSYSAFCSRLMASLSSPYLALIRSICGFSCCTARLDSTCAAPGGQDNRQHEMGVAGLWVHLRLAAAALPGSSAGATCC